MRPHPPLLVLLAALLPAVMGVGAGASERPPQRVVSLNLCGDEQLLRLADREVIASVTFLAADPLFSSVIDRAKGLPLNHGKAEEIVPLQPDLVIAEPYTARNAVRFLQRLDVPLLELPVPTTFEEVYRQIEQLAQALGQEERGRKLVEDMQRRLAALGPPPPGPRPLAAVYQPNGFLIGPGTLVHEVLTRAGLRNLATEAFQDHNGPLPVEMLLWHRPDLLILNHDEEAPVSLAHAILHHPALQQAFSEMHRVVIHPSLWTCGGPGLVEATEILRKAVLELQQAEAAQ